MTPAPTATRLFSPLVAAMASLVCAQAACSLRSLDYLQNGDRRDGAVGNQDSDMSTPDTVSPSGALLDAIQDDGAVRDAPALDAPPDAPPTLDGSKLDSPIRDSLVLDTRAEIGNDQGTDTSTPDTVGSDGARLDATQRDGTVLDAPVLDVPPTLDGSNPDKPDAVSRADTASGGSTGTAEAGTPQGGAGGSSSSGGTSSTGGTSNSGGSSKNGGTGGGAGGQGGTGGQGGATGGTAGSTSTATCSGILRAGICWYLGPQGSSCQQACASHGQPASGAASHVGTATQGGSLAECGVILGLLGITGTPSTSLGLEGLGCFMRANGSLYWLSLPNFSATASTGNASLVCGCTQ
ncbi:MAG TPA: hypothetical protein VJ801_19490 [Polyangia bacterium]|jgi:hypothetical protein|nr:hypothetical protein [Polyangia bacterium]